jgi:hypothetical protein
MLEVIIYFSEVIENWDAIDKTIIEQLSNVLLVFFTLKPVANNIGILPDFSFGIQAPNQWNIEGGGSLNMNVIF